MQIEQCKVSLFNIDDLDDHLTLPVTAAARLAAPVRRWAWAPCVESPGHPRLERLVHGWWNVAGSNGGKMPEKCLEVENYCWILVEKCLEVENYCWMLLENGWKLAGNLLDSQWLNNCWIC